MADEQNLPFRAVIESGKTLQLGDETWVVVDRDVPVEYVDLLTEFRHHNGVVSLAFASAVIDGANQREAHICARLRMNLVYAQQLHSVLGDIIKEALTPINQSKAN